MAFHHCVMFRWTDDVDADHIARVAARLDTLPGLIPEIKRYHHGRDAGVNAGNYDYVVVGEFDDVDGYLTYRDQPDHQELIAELITGRVAERAAVQFES
jgi:hypothetical protein